MQNKDARQKLVQLSVDKRDSQMLGLLAQQPGFSAAGLNLHPALHWLPRELLQQLVEAGCLLNQRDS